MWGKAYGLNHIKFTKTHLNILFGWFGGGMRMRRPGWCEGGGVEGQRGGEFLLLQDMQREWVIKESKESGGEEPSSTNPSSSFNSTL